MFNLIVIHHVYIETHVYMLLSMVQDILERNSQHNALGGAVRYIIVLQLCSIIADTM